MTIFKNDYKKDFCLGQLVLSKGHLMFANMLQERVCGWSSAMRVSQSVNDVGRLAREPGVRACKLQNCCLKLDAGVCRVSRSPGDHCASGTSGTHSHPFTPEV